MTNVPTTLDPRVSILLGLHIYNLLTYLSLGWMLFRMGQKLWKRLK